MDDKTREKLELVAFLMKEAEKQNKYTATELSSILHLPSAQMYQLYALINVMNGYSYQLSYIQLVDVLLANKNNELLSSKLDKEAFELLEFVNKIMRSIDNGERLSASNMGKLLGIDKDSIQLIYSLYDMNKNSKKVSVSLVDFTDFVIRDVLTNKAYSSNLIRRVKNN